ncbi:MAG TPA: orotidine-5'-phosphate decarboxylase [Candidatus Saccharimonadales bacterium]|nr:orotidine-5'-phosphate decarboxylase [Candidatus Saccharimonadales bacterium]
MPSLRSELTPAERVIQAIDTSNQARAEELVTIAKEAGAWVVKIGLEYSTATSWKEASSLAQNQELDWVADAKFDDIPNTTAGAVNNLLELDHPPVGITIQTKSGIKSMAAAQKLAKEANVMMLGVTHLTSIGKEETKDIDKVLPSTVVSRETYRAQEAGIEGLVASGEELKMLQLMAKGMFKMIPGTRSAGADRGDQARSITPQQAIEQGADLLVIGRQVSQADDPAAAYAAVVEEIQQGLWNRAA